MRSRLLFNALQQQPRALRHAPLPNTQKNQQRIFATLYFVRSFLSIYLCNGLPCAVFLTIYFDFDYIFLYI